MIILTGLLIAPHFIDWSNYKQDFEREASRALGQPVKVTGKADLRILPMPSISFTGLDVGKNEDGSALMTVDRFSLNAELMPFLQGQLRITQMELVRPVVNLHMGKDNTVSWPKSQPSRVAPQNVKLDKVRIEDGRFRVKRSTDGRVFEGKQIFAEMSARSLLGPWNVIGEGVFGGKTTELKIITGSLANLEKFRMRVEMVRKGFDYRMAADGSVTFKEGVPGWSGRFDLSPLKINASNSANTASKEDYEGRGQGALPLKLSGQFLATPDEVLVPDYRLESGKSDNPYTITGNGTFKLDDDVNFRIEADGRQFDFDEWSIKKQQKANTENGKESNYTQGKSLGERLEFVRNIVDRLPIPDANGVIDMVLPAITTGDTYIRDVKAKIRPFDGSWRFDELTAVLPGNTLLEAKGTLGRAKEFGFTGHLTVASGQPSGLAAWLGSDGDPAIRQLGSAGISARVTITPLQALFDNMELVLDDTSLKGSVRLVGVGRNGEKNEGGAMIARLKGDKMDIDRLRAAWLLVMGKQDDHWSNNDLHVELEANTVEGFGLTADGVNARLKVEHDQLSIQQLDIDDFYGVNFSSTGRLVDWQWGQRPLGDMRLELKSGDAYRLLKMLADRFEDQLPIRHLVANPQLVKDAKLSIEIASDAAGEGASSNIIVNGAIGGTVISSNINQNSFPDDDSKSSLGANLTLKNDDPLHLARQLGLKVEEVTLQGPVDVSLDVTQNGQSGTGEQYSSELSIYTPLHNLSLRGEARVDEKGVWQGQQKVTLSSTNILPLLSASGYGPTILQSDIVENENDDDNGQTALPGTFAFNLGYDGGKIDIGDLMGQVNGNGITGNLSLFYPGQEKPAVAAAKGRQKLRINGKLDFAELSVEELVALLGGGQESDITGLVARDLFRQFGSSVTGFGLSRLDKVRGEIGITANRFYLFGDTEAKQFSSRFAIGEGQLRLKNAKMEWLGGEAKGDFRLANKDGTVSVDSSYSATGLDLNELLLSLGLEFSETNPPQGKVMIKGEARTLGSNETALLEGLSANGVLSVSDGMINGFRLSGLSRVVEAAKAKDFKLDETSVGKLVNAAFFQGQYPFSLPEQSFSVVSGNLKLNRVHLVPANDNPRGNISGEAVLALDIGRFDGSADITLNASEAAIAGADPKFNVSFKTPESGLSIERKVNVQPMVQFLSLLAIEREQRRVDWLQSDALERQRLRREMDYLKQKKQLREAALERAREKERQQQEQLRIDGIREILKNDTTGSLYQ